MAVVVLNWKAPQYSIACVESLLRLDYEVGIYLCDNASPDDSIKRFREWSGDRLKNLNTIRLAAGRAPATFCEPSNTPFKPTKHPQLQETTVTLISIGANLGYAGGNNVGIRQALQDGYDYVWVLNNDTEVKPDAVTWLLRRMREDPRVGLCGSTLIYFDHRDMIQNLGGADFDVVKGRGLPIGLHQPANTPIDGAAVEAKMKYVSGAAAMVSRRFVEDVGVMQEDYFLYWEELDWSMRAKGRFLLGYAPLSIVYHKVGASIGSNDFGERSSLSDYFFLRNRIKLCGRFSKISLPFIYLDTFRDILRWGLRGRWDRAKLLARAAFGLPYKAS